MFDQKLTIHVNDTGLLLKYYTPAHRYRHLDALRRSRHSSRRHLVERILRVHLTIRQAAALNFAQMGGEFLFCRTKTLKALDRKIYLHKNLLGYSSASSQFPRMP